MPLSRAWYVRARKRAFPNAEAWVAGPYDMDGAARAAIDLADRYPEATLRADVRVAKDLPELTPRPRPCGAAPYDLSTVKGRDHAAQAIAEFGEGLGLDVQAVEWVTDWDVTLTTATGRALVEITGAAPLPRVTWHAFGGRTLREIAPPNDWADLLAKLESGLLAMIDGSAFDN